MISCDRSTCQEIAMPARAREWESRVFIRPMEIKEDGFLHSAFYGSARRLLFIRCLGKRSAHYSCRDLFHPRTCTLKASPPHHLYIYFHISVEICISFRTSQKTRVFAPKNSIKQTNSRVRRGRISWALVVVVLAGVVHSHRASGSDWLGGGGGDRRTNGLSSRVPRRRLTCAPNPPVSSPCPAAPHCTRRRTTKRRS